MTLAVTDVVAVTEAVPLPERLSLAMLEGEAVLVVVLLGERDANQIVPAK